MMNQSPRKNAARPKKRTSRGSKMLLTNFVKRKKKRRDLRKKPRLGVMKKIDF